MQTKALNKLYLTSLRDPSSIPIAQRFCRSPLRCFKTFTLNTGAKIPSIGIGTFQDPDEQEDAVATALKLGYRHIDTARVYDTEAQVGRGLRKSGVPREEVFLTTKLWSNSHHPDDVEPAVNDSLRDLQTEYLDLLLMHYPCSFKRGPVRFPREDASGEIILADGFDYVDCWKAMEALLSTGKVKAIGMSNFSKGEMENILQKGSVTPAVHQMELHPYLAQHRFSAWHREHGIQLIQFSPFANQNTFYKHGQSMPKLLEDKTLRDIGRKHSKSAAQVALAWGIAKDRCVIPKSTILWQLEENLDSDFDLTAEDMARIDGLDRKLRFNLKGLNYGWKLYSDLEGIGKAPSVELSPF